MKELNVTNEKMPERWGVLAGQKNTYTASDFKELELIGTYKDSVKTEIHIIFYKCDPSNGVKCAE